MAVRRVTRGAASTSPAEEAPSRARRRRPAPSEVEEEQEVDVAPRRRRNAASPDTSRSRGSSSGVGDDTDDEEDEEDLSHLTEGGWKNAEKNRKATSNFAEEFQITKEPTLVKMLEEEPFSSYKQHWIEIPGKKSWICIGDDCPLCDIGSELRAFTAFNCFDMEDGKNKILLLGSKATAVLKALNDDSKTGPISRDDMYYGISKSGSKQQVSYNIQAVKERDVKDDWNLEPLSDEELDKYEGKKFTKKAIPIFGHARLLEVAKEASKK